MIPHVNSLSEAMDFFLANHSGTVICLSADGLKEKECASYPEAEAFYAE